MSQKAVLAYDLGGTKVAVGVVNSRGRVLAEVREPVLFSEGKGAVIDQLADLGKIFLRKYPQVRHAGIASAGPLDPATGTLLDPTNFSSKGRSWGKVPLATLLSKKLKRPVHLENDAAAAILAEKWAGAAKGYENAMILTLGTGLGTGIICNDELVRAGRGLHPEAGHIIIYKDDVTALCGCGNYGCAEAYLSGNGFERRNAHKLGNPALRARDIAELARSGNRAAKAAFDEYAELMAVAMHNYVTIYAPEVIVLTGSFAQASDLFLASTRTHLKKLLARRRSGVDLMPKLALSKLDNRAGLIGGAWVALRHLDA